MNEASFTPLGSLPSLHDNSKTCLKSRFLDSRTPIIWSPAAGSPWKGIDVVCMSCWMSCKMIFRLASSSPLLVIVLRRLRRVYIRKSDSFCIWFSDSVSLSLMAIRFTWFCSHSMNSRLVLVISLKMLSSRKE